MYSLMNSIQKEIRNRKGDFVIFLAVALGGWLFGVALFLIMQYFSGEKDAWVSLGVMLGSMGTVFMVLANGVLQVTMVLDLAISMGQRRRDYYWANFIVLLLQAMACLVTLILLGFLERWIFAGYSSTVKDKLDILPWVLRWGVPVLPMLCAVSTLVGLMLHHFGKWMSVVASGLFVAVCWSPMILGKIRDASDGSMFWGMNRAMQDFYHWLTVPRALLIFAAVTAAALAAGRILVRNEAVKA